MSVTSSEIAYLPLSVVAGLVERRELSPVQVTSEILSRIESIDGKVNAYYTVFADEALASARAAEKEIVGGSHRGPLHGIPVAVKDIYKCGPTTGGSKMRADYVADTDAAVVTKLKEAGAVILGKVATYEFAFGSPTHASHFAPARNPWQLDLDPGGSSSGSGAAVAAGLAFAATASDTAGSIRWPAFSCGIVGMKATYGRVSRVGVFPLSWSLDHAGMLARTVRDSALLLQACAGYDPADPGSVDAPVPDYSAGIEDGIRGLRIGIPERLFADSCDPEILASFNRAVEEMEALGATVAVVESISLKQALAAVWPPLMADAAAIHLKDMRERPQDYQRDLRLYLAAGMLISGTAYIQALRAREQVRAEMLRQLDEIDVFMLPTVGMLSGPIPAEPGGPSLISADEVPLYTMVYNLSGMPAMSVPCGFTEGGLPIGFQIAAKPFAEPLLFTAGFAYEQATNWRERHPAL